jgi:hypothetical protein
MRLCELSRARRIGCEHRCDRRPAREPVDQVDVGADRHFPGDERFADPLDRFPQNPRAFELLERDDGKIGKQAGGASSVMTQSDQAVDS